MELSLGRVSPPKDPLDSPLLKSQHVANSPTPEQEMHLNPAQYVIFIFKGVRAAARAIGRSPGSVSKWQNARSGSGSSGDIPIAAQRMILEYARKNGLDIKAEDLLYGRKVAKRLLQP